MYVQHLKQFYFSIFSCRELNLVERCQLISSRRATKDEIMLLHSEEHYKLLEKTSGVHDDEKMEDFSSHYDSVYIHPVSFCNTHLKCKASMVLNCSFCFCRPHLICHYWQLVQP